MHCNHGNQCSCQLLSMAVTGKPDACSYAFCRKVLQPRWIMDCNHGATLVKPEDSPYYEPVIHMDGSMELVAKPHDAVVDHDNK